MCDDPAFVRCFRLMTLTIPYQADGFLCLTGPVAGGGGSSGNAVVSMSSQVSVLHHCLGVCLCVRRQKNGSILALGMYDTYVPFFRVLGAHTAASHSRRCMGIMQFSLAMSFGCTLHRPATRTAWCNVAGGETHVCFGGIQSVELLPRTAERATLCKR